MIRKIYDLLPQPFQQKTNMAWLQENDVELKTFYNRLDSPKIQDYKFYSLFWGVSIEELMNDVSLATIAVKTIKKSEVKYMMQVVDFMSENKHLQLV